MHDEASGRISQLLYRGTMDPKETVYGGVVWVHVTQGTYKCKALVNTVMNIRIPQRRRIY
jgi:hypothetical protein